MVEQTRIFEREHNGDDGVEIDVSFDHSIVIVAYVTGMLTKLVRT